MFAGGGVKSRLDALASVVLVLTAGAVSITYAAKTFLPSQQTRAGVPASATRMLNWSEAVAIGHTIIGDDRSASTMVVFEDLECPACRGFNSTLQRVISN